MKLAYKVTLSLEDNFLMFSLHLKVKESIQAIDDELKDITYVFLRVTARKLTYDLVREQGRQIKLKIITII